MKIDLNTCKPGYKLKLRDGSVCWYVRCGVPDDICSEYTHTVYSGDNDEYYMDDGHYYEHRPSDKDVIAIKKCSSDYPPVDKDAKFLANLYTPRTPYQAKRLRAIIRRLNGGRNVD